MTGTAFTDDSPACMWWTKCNGAVFCSEANGSNDASGLRLPSLVEWWKCRLPAVISLYKLTLRCSWGTIGREADGTFARDFCSAVLRGVVTEQQ